MIMKNDAKFEKKTDLWFGKWHEEFDEFWSKHYFSPKYIILELKEYRGVMFDGTEDWCKVWRKTDLHVQNWQEFGKF